MSFGTAPLTTTPNDRYLATARSASPASTSPCARQYCSPFVELGRIYSSRSRTQDGRLVTGLVHCRPPRRHHSRSLVAPAARSAPNINIIFIIANSSSRTGILIKAAWIPGSGCTITDTDNTLLAATFIYSMCFDFLVLILTAYKLAFPTRRRDQSRIVQLIFGDGLIYFMIAWVPQVACSALSSKC